MDALDSRYGDLLHAATYADDEPVHVFLPETEAEAEVWVTERLFDRMQAVAVGYGLRVLPLLAAGEGCVLVVDTGSSTRPRGCSAPATSPRTG